MRRLIIGTADTKAEEVKAGDTKDNGGTGTGNKDTQAASGEQVTLTVMDGYAPEDPHGQYIYQYAEEFMKENPDIKVEIQAIASGDIYTKLAAWQPPRMTFPPCSSHLLTRCPPFMTWV